MNTRILAGIVIVAVIIGLVGCTTEKNPTSSAPIDKFPLAGGGRLTDNDPAGGHVDSNSPGLPPTDSLPGLVPLFVSWNDCAENPGERIITNQQEWDNWWKAANACLFEEPWPPDTGWWDTVPHDTTPWDSIPGDSNSWDTIPWDTSPWDSMPLDTFPEDTLPWDSMWHDTMWNDSSHWDTTNDTVIWPDTGYGGAPPVNFDSFVVIVIALAPDSMTFGRSLWVDEVSTDAAGTVVRYTVSSLGDDCVQILMMPMLLSSSAVIAVMAPRPIVEPVTWIRSDTVFHCIWEPDPNVPVTLYFTDTPCELGLGETVITDSASFAAWKATAYACDSLRWRNWYDSGNVPGGLSMWFNPEVNFSTHAVIILRSGDQTRLGGGIWLDRFDVTDGGTIIDYTVMEPTDNCWIVPPPLGVVNPTVAIRVPLPINAPITWNRAVQPIQCNWSDTTGIGGSGFSGQ